jgi:hypothetical protein
MQDLFSVDADVRPSHEAMHQLFIRAKQGLTKRIVDHVGPRPGSADPADVKDLAITRSHSR